MQCIDLLACPFCGTALQQTDNTLRCANAHSFDIAREGYVNLLRKKLPGDSKEMLQARRAFFAQGHYQPLANALNELIWTHLPTTLPEADVPAPLHILDAGCGEGYYLDRLRTALGERHYHTRSIGIDISKDAVRMAAKRYKDDCFVVANLKEPLVIHTSALHILLNIFAPRNAAEFARVLMPHGLLAIVIPGPGHLAQLREKLCLLHIEEHKQQHVTAQFAAHFTPIATKTVTYPLHLSNQEIEQVVMMTPNYWHLSDQTRDAMARLQEIETTVEFTCLLFLRR